MSIPRIPDLLFVAAAAIFATSAILHVQGLELLRRALLERGLGPESLAALSAIWMSHALALLLTAMILVLAVLRPARVSREVLALLLFGPLTTAGLLTTAVGAVQWPAGLLLVGSVLAATAILMRPEPRA